MNENLWGFGPERHLSVEDRLDILLERLIALQTILVEHQNFQVDRLESLEKKMSQIVDQLVANVKAEDGVIASAQTLLNGLAAALDQAIQLAQAGDFNALTSLSQDVKQQTANLASAVAAGNAAVGAATDTVKQIAVTAPKNAVDGVPFPVLASAEAADGTPVAPSPAAAFTLTVGDVTVGPTNTDANGTVQFSVTLPAGTGYVASVSDGTVTGKSAAFDVATAAPTTTTGA